MDRSCSSLAESSWSAIVKLDSKFATYLGFLLLPAGSLHILDVENDLIAEVLDNTDVLGMTICLCAIRGATLSADLGSARANDLIASILIVC